MLEKEAVRKEIRTLIARREARMRQLQEEKAGVNKDEKPVKYRFLVEDIARLDHANMALVELEHNLHLCDCPDEAYTEEGSTS